MRNFILVLIVSVVFLLMTNQAFARMGVGMGTGTITIEEELRSGEKHSLPNLIIVNTGDETTRYNLGTAYYQDQEELAPPREWFTFSDSDFELEPGAIYSVEATLQLPFRTMPGKYFVFLEAYPETSIEQGGQTHVDIAAATKLYFTVVPDNIFEAIYFKLSLFWQKNSTLLTLLLIAGSFGVGFAVVRMNFHIDIKKK